MLLKPVEPVTASALFMSAFMLDGTRSARLAVCIVESDTDRYEAGLVASHTLQHESMQISFVHHDGWIALHMSAYATLINWRSKQFTGHASCGARLK
jgi:hypothetical protein